MFIITSVLIRGLSFMLLAGHDWPVSISVLLGRFLKESAQPVGEEETRASMYTLEDVLRITGGNAAPTKPVSMKEMFTMRCFLVSVCRGGAVIEVRCRYARRSFECLPEA